MASIAAKTTATKFLNNNRIASFGFSGAGFLTCYHLGVVDCLMKHGILLKPGELPKDDNFEYHTTSLPILTGVSGGALAATAASVGVNPEDGMRATLAITDSVRKAGGVLDVLQPGVSLIDYVEKVLLELTKDIDEEYVRRRTRNGSLLRIGLTDSQQFPRFRENPNSYVYVDQYDSTDEIIAACILSSYVPGLTGPMLEASLQKNDAVRRANRHLNAMMTKGAVKNSFGVALNTFQNKDGHNFWDGGLANLFPIVDGDTCLVTPFAGTFSNMSISPPPNSTTHKLLQVSQYAYLHLCLQNVHALRHVAFSSSDRALEAWFEQGHNDSLRFLESNNLITEFSVPLGGSRVAA